MFQLPLKIRSKKLTTLLSLLLASQIAFAQSHSCDCPKNLDTLIAKTEKNYAGFPVKVNYKNLNEYQNLKKNLTAQALKTGEAKPCFYLLSQYVQFFYDRHFNLSYYNPDEFDHEVINLTETAFKNQFSTQKRDALEGIWVNQDNSLKLGILKYPKQVYKAVVLEANDPKIPKGLVYMTITKGKRGLTVKYYDSFSSTTYPISLRGNLLQGWSQEIFGKVFPTQMSESERREMSTWLNYNNGLDFYKLSPKTAVLKIPTFGNNDDKIAMLVQQHDSIIRTTENLIVDLTGNGGGGTGWVSFLGYFMTKPVAQQNGFVRVSPENVALKLADIEPFVKYPIPDGYEKYFPESTLNTYRTAYAELPTTKNECYPVPGVTFPLDSITVNPKKIALVVDHLCGSSTEYFFHLSKSSDKTTTYGINTFGMMDYEGASATSLPYEKFSLSIPIVKSSWTDTKPIDKTGFTPDVHLGKIKPETWIKHIQSKLEK